MPTECPSPPRGRSPKSPAIALQIASSFSWASGWDVRGGGWRDPAHPTPPSSTLRHPKARVKSLRRFPKDRPRHQTFIQPYGIATSRRSPTLSRPISHPRKNKPLPGDSGEGFIVAGQIGNAFPFSAPLLGGARGGSSRRKIAPLSRSSSPALLESNCHSHPSAVPDGQGCSAVAHHIGGSPASCIPPLPDCCPPPPHR